MQVQRLLTALGGSKLVISRSSTLIEASFFTSDTPWEVVAFSAFAHAPEIIVVLPLLVMLKVKCLKFSFVYPTLVLISY